jgi:hypothetical protein
MFPSTTELIYWYNSRCQLTLTHIADPKINLVASVTCTVDIIYWKCQYTAKWNRTVILFTHQCSDIPSNLSHGYEPKD